MPQCQHCQNSFEIKKEDLAFLDKLAPIINGIKYDLPLPDLCPDCRRQRRLSFRNERILYKRKCNFSDKEIISNYSQDKPHKVYERSLWWSDKFDPLEYGQDIDFNRPFFEQIGELILKTPVFALSASPDAEEQNCSYVNFASFNKDCYMMFDSDASEQCFYSNVMKHSLRCIDCTYTQYSELCYECTDCIRGYHLLYSQNSINCSDSAFLKNCTGCKHCFMCSNLVQKEYYVRNKSCPKEEFEKIWTQLQSSAQTQQFHKEFANFILKFPQKESHFVNAENGVGDYISNAKNCYYSFDISEGEDIRCSDALYKAKDCCDVSSFGEGIEHIYFSGTIGFNVYNVAFCFACRVSCSDLLYCFNCYKSHHCFGCVSLKGNQYCIFNKQYSKEDYENLVPKLIAYMEKTKEWGQFFPVKLSPFGYNETVAQEYFPLTKEEALKQHFAWSGRKEEPSTAEKTILAEKLPDTLDSIPDKVLQWAIQCPATHRLFRLIKSELKFYRDLKLPLPRLHPDERHKRRMAQRTPRKLWPRSCQKCGKEILTPYSPHRPEIVYCEKCYLKEMY